MALEGYTKLHLEITDDGTIKQWDNQMVSLQKQVRYLRQELSNTSYNEAQRQSVRLLLADAQMGLQATQTRSRELFGSLSLLPGPMGNLFGVVNMTLIAMRELSQLSFNDLKSQFQILKSTFTGESLAGNIPRFGNEVNTASNLANTGSNVANTTATSAEAAALGTTAAAQKVDTIATTANTNEQILNAKARDIDTLAILKTQEALTQEYIIDRQNSLATLENTETENLNTKARMRNSLQTEISVEKQNLLNIQEKIGIAITNGLTGSTEGLTGANVAATTSTILFTVAMRALDVAIVIAEVSLAAFYALLGAVILIPIGAFLKEWATGTNAATVANDQLNTSIKDTKDILDLDLISTKKRQSDRLAEMKAGNASEAALRKQDLENAKEDYNLYNNALSDARKNLQTAEENTKRKGGILGISNEELDKAQKLYEDAQKSVNDLEKKRTETAAEVNKAGYSGIEEEQKRSYQNQLRDLEAKIELEIKKENTSKDELTKLIKQKNDLIDKENVNIQLSQKERDLRDKLDRKKINDAIIEDELRRAQAIIDLHTREKEAAAKDSEEYFKSLKDIAQAEYDKQIIEAEKSEHDKANLILNAKTKLQKELDNINIASLNSQLKILKETQQGLIQYTNEYYQNELDIINKNEAIELADYEGNEKMKLVIKEKYNKERLDLESKQLMDNANLLKRLGESETEGNLGTPKNVNKSIDAKYKQLQQSLDLEYQAEIKNKKKTSTELAAIDQEYNKKSKELSLQKLDEKQAYEQKYVELAKYTGEFVMALGEAEMSAAQGKDKSKFESAKKYAVAGIWLEKAAALGSIYMNTQKAMSQDMGKFGVFGIPLTAIDLAIGVAQAAGVIVAGATAASSINGTDFTPANVRGPGKNYGMGGMINGPSHSQGGVPITAEGGEAVMTRGAVTAFAPLLSLMNQAGGGTAFSSGIGGPRYDTPKTVGGPLEQQIIKTFVVESDLTTMQHKAARLKSLSTL